MFGKLTDNGTFIDTFIVDVPASLSWWFSIAMAAMLVYQRVVWTWWDCRRCCCRSLTDSIPRFYGNGWKCLMKYYGLDYLTISLYGGWASPVLARFFAWPGTNLESFWVSLRVDALVSCQVVESKNLLRSRWCMMFGLFSHLLMWFPTLWHSNSM